ncbi:MAG TPA: hypothetical protein VFM18_17385 [Methanosarcina sp.]|nr:hypothetical protein [Methanosarcina sp.]
MVHNAAMSTAGMSNVPEPNGGDGVVVWEIEWTEFERGWGQRPDGFSYFATHELALEYKRDFLNGMPPEAPECYSAPGNITIVWVDPVFALMVRGKGVVWTDSSQKR